MERIAHGQSRAERATYLRGIRDGRLQVHDVEGSQAPGVLSGKTSDRGDNLPDLETTDGRRTQHDAGVRFLPSDCLAGQAVVKE
jgi:hypothetical protein